MARPKSKIAAPLDLVADEKSCGYILHQKRSTRCKMRWGELLMGKDERQISWCQITLFKFSLTNPKLGMLAKKDLKLKATFHFTEENFCGLEKGQHITEHGMKRYICIILRDQHIIFQDAIIAMTNANHDVIQTWYNKITNAMRYMYRWKILAINDTKFLHVSKANTSVCFSLHNSNGSMKGKVLLHKQYKTEMIEKVEEQQEKLPDGSPCVRALLDIRDHHDRLCFILECGKSLSSIINSVNHTNPMSLDFYQNPNLVKVPRQPKRDMQASNFKKLPDESQVPKTNTYVPNLPRSTDTTQLPKSDQRQHTNGEGTHLPASRVELPQTRANNAPQTHNHRGRPPQIPPRDQDDDLKKASDTVVSIDSGFHTSNCTQLTTDTQSLSLGVSLNGSSSPYVNLDDLNMSAPMSSMQSQDLVLSTILHEEPVPELPTRDIPITAPTDHSVDLIERALRNQTLPPLDPNPEARLPGYENSLNIEVTIDLVLHHNHGDNIDVSLGLPHSAYIAIVLGLENETVADGDWRGLASALAMSFEDVMQIEAATHRRERLYPAHIVLVHWLRTQAPYPFTRASLRSLLSQVMSRPDLANLVPAEDM